MKRSGAASRAGVAHRLRAARRTGSWRRSPGRAGATALLACNQAGLVNNLNDGLAWGLLPVFFAGAGLSVDQVGILAATYPAVWGLLQVGTGALRDRWGRRPLIVAGMGLQGASLLLLAGVFGFGPWLLATGLLGLGTALIYPTLLASVGD